MAATYRNRLMYLMTVIGVLMAILLLVSYSSARWVIREDAAWHLQQTVKLYERNLASDRIDLARYARSIRDDNRIQDYSFAVIRIGAADDSLKKLIQGHMARVPVDAIFVTWEGGIIMEGVDTALLRDEIRFLPADVSNTSFYIETNSEIFLAAILPLNYQDEQIGQIVVVQNLGKNWISSRPRDRQTQLFLERGGTVLDATEPGFKSIPFDAGNKEIIASGSSYQIVEVTLPAGKNVQTRFWLAQSDTATVETLSRYNKIMSGLSVIALGIILFTALFAVNSFSRPIKRLIDLTREMANGQLPTLKRTKGDTEINQLLNQFIDLIEALKREQAEVREAHSKLKISAVTDEQTGLYNRRYLNEIYPKILAQADREGLCISALLVDIDFFKRINDTFGHLAGDACLKVFADTLCKNSRASDFIFRMGGEEFLILTAGSGESRVETLAEKIRTATEIAEVRFHDESIRFTVSCGISCVQRDSSYQPTLSHLISLADQALYTAKKEGRNCVRLSQAIYEESTEAL